MSTIIEKDQYVLLYRSSHLFLISGAYALYRGHYMVSVSPCVIYLTSLNYWRYPDHSWRLHLDVCAVRLALLYQLIMAYNAEYAREYSLICITSLLYPLGQYYYYKRDYWKYTYVHIACHVLVNIANIVLYSGRINTLV